MHRLRKNSGWTLVELAIVIIIIGIIAAVATQKMSTSIETARYQQTKQEMEQLVFAIVGNPNVYSSGTRTDFGYVGDVGALPDSLGALVTNPGGYSTWDGPYMGTGYNEDDFKKDAWGFEYTYQDTLIRSTGSGSNIDKLIARSSDAVLSNTVTGFVVDANHDVPGTEDTTSLTISLVYPDGSGGTTTSTVYPRPNGNFTFAGVPIGAHTLQIVYVAENDTATYNVSVAPASTTKLSITFPADLW
ncbi:MAG: type II secretion system protein GspG [Candidatus Zixiibacteriota bacterium]|nr:MAG: type II secretion system protein GspG [candidate division Zixibacteria bacterium]